MPTPPPARSILTYFWQLFVPSPRNSLDAHVKLLKDYQCKTFLYTEDLPSSRKIINGIKHQIELEIIAVPTPSYFLHPSFDAPHYKYIATYDEAKFQPFVAMHTSGSTGTPKPIVMPQGVITSLDAAQKAPSLYDFHTTSDYWRDLRCFLTFPLFRKHPHFLTSYHRIRRPDSCFSVVISFILRAFTG